MGKGSTSLCLRITPCSEEGTSSVVTAVPTAHQLLLLPMRGSPKQSSLHEVSAGDTWPRPSAGELVGDHRKCVNVRN